MFIVNTYKMWNIKYYTLYTIAKRVHIATLVVRILTFVYTMLTPEALVYSYAVETGCPKKTFSLIFFWLKLELVKY